MTDIEKILEAAGRDGRPVSEELLPLVYDELKSLAAALAMRRDRGRSPGRARHE